MMQMFPYICKRVSVDTRFYEGEEEKAMFKFIITGSGCVAVASLFKLVALFIKQLIIVNYGVVACFSRVKYLNCGYQ